VVGLLVAKTCLKCGRPIGFKDTKMRKKVKMQILNGFLSKNKMRMVKSLDTMHG